MYVGKYCGIPHMLVIIRYKYTNSLSLGSTKMIKERKAWFLETYKKIVLVKQINRNTQNPIATTSSQIMASRQFIRNDECS